MTSDDAPAEFEASAPADPGSGDPGPAPNPAADGDERTLPWLVLEAGERLHWRGRPRIQTVYPWLAVAVLGTVAVLAGVALETVSPWGLLWIPAVVVPVLWQYARVTRTEFAITTERVAVRSGVFGIAVRVAAIERIQNTTTAQDPIGRLFGYGTVAVETASGSTLSFWNLERPAAVQTRLEAQRDRRAGTDVPGTRAQWETILEEVRGWRLAVDRERGSD